MDRRTRAWLVATALLLAVAFAIPTPKRTGATTISTAPGGLHGAWLLARDATTPAHDHRTPWSSLPTEPTDRPQLLVVQLPLARRTSPEDRAALISWLEAGHHVVLQTTGARSDLPSWLSRPPLRLRLEAMPVQEDAALASWWSPVDVPSTEDGPAARLPSLDARFVGASEDVVHFAADGGPAVRSRHLAGGTVHLIDGPLLSNRWLSRSTAHTAWWTRRLAESGGVWFDDHHQGLVAIDDITEATNPWPVRALFLHLLVAWLVGVWSVARPFGTRPALPLPPRSAVSTQLRALARLHAHHGHARGAIDQLRASAHGPGPVPDAPAIASDDTLLSLARAIARLQERGRLA